jgi:ubiquinone/menaquinone biosynthesis C-methylase UbiE
MNDDILKSIAAQLRKPHGEYASQVGKNMNVGNKIINQHTIEALKLKAHDNVLEIGMGNGFFVKDILAAGKDIMYAGCDFSEIMVQEASAQNEMFVKAGKANFIVAGADNLPFENAVFDKVFTINTIYFWEDQQNVLSELGRVLKSTGQLIISVRPKSVMQTYPFVKYGFNMFDKDDLVKLLSDNNFHVTEVIEKKEPDQEISGEKIKVETLIVCANKRSLDTSH